jgi:AcrR family transcriptional regulator
VSTYGSAYSPAVAADAQDDSPRRRDARDNRERLVAAAREVFAESGFDVPLDAIARRAGVGRATLYRNFPDRYALGSAIFEHNLATLEALARAHAGRADAFTILLSAIIEQQIASHALVPALMTGPTAPDLEALRRRMTRLLAAPLRQAQTAGQIRRDLVAADVLSVIAMVSAVVIHAPSVAARRRRAARALQLVLDGLIPRD